MSNTKDNTAIYRVYEGLIATASNISNFVVGQKQDVDYDITELANGYIQAEQNNDKLLCDAYTSALMIRYWHMIAQIHRKLKQFNVGVEEVVNILYESIHKAFRYRSWLDSSKHVSKEARGAEKVINQCITSTVSNYIKALNVNKNKLIDNSVDLADVESSVSYNDYYNLSGCRNLVAKCINNRDYLLAMIIDCVSFKDCDTKRAICKNISDAYVNSFIKEYHVKDCEVLKKEFRNFNNLSETLKTREISRCIKQLQKNEMFVRSYLC